MRDGQERRWALVLVHGSFAQFAVVGAVALLAFLLADHAAGRTRFNPDESRWLARAHYVAALRDPFGPTWADRYMTRGQPPLGSYAMGLGLLLQGRDLRTNPPWDFALPWEENIATGNKPAAADLAAGRRASAALVALTAAVVVALARLFLTQAGAVAAGLLYAVHPFTRYIGSLAMSDALFGLLIALSAWAAARLARRPGWPRAALLGALLGLGGATKLSPLAVAAGLSAAALGGFIWASARPGTGPGPARRMAWLGLGVGLVAGATFVAVYPYLWPDPVGRTGQLFAFRAEEMATQASDWPVMAVPTRVEAVHRVALNFTERFNLSAALFGWLGAGEAPPPLRWLEFLIAASGIVILAWAALRDGPYSPRMLALLVLGGQVAVTILGMRSEFDRYHVPMALLGAVAAAAVLEWGTRRALGIWRARGWPQLAALSRFFDSARADGFPSEGGGADVGRHAQ